MKRVLMVILVGVFLALITASFANAQPKDVKGWRGARWGMTEEQILEAFKEEAVRLEEVKKYDEWYASIGIEDFEIRGDEFYVHFLMCNKEKTLQQVNIRAKEVTFGTIRIVFKSLEQLLVEKYGKPSLENEEEYKTSTVWNFPSTVIELSCLIMRDIDFYNLIITYRPPRKGALDKI